MESFIFIGDNCQEYDCSSDSLQPMDNYSNTTVIEIMDTSSNSVGVDIEELEITELQIPVIISQEIITGNTNNQENTQENTLNGKTCRKRSADPQEWKANVAKRRCNLGQSYVTSKGIEKECRKMRAPCQNCRFKCSDRITEDERQSIFEQFWNLGDHTRQWDFISMHVKTKAVERRTTNWHSSRHVARVYTLPIGGKQIRVCQHIFLETFGISEAWIRTASKKLKGCLSPDGRGKNSKCIKMKGQLLQSIEDHINAMPRVPSHYCRRDSNKAYLEEGLSIRKLHELYIDYMKNKQIELDEEAKAGKKAATTLSIASERQCRNVFNNKFNISFFSPRKDQCDQCVAWKIATPEVQSTLSQKYENHITNKEAVRVLKDEQKTRARKDPSFCLASFDLQKVLNTHQGEISSFYYVSKLAVYNFTVFDIGRSDGYCYCWSEETARRGCNEVGSFLMDFVEKKVTQDSVIEFEMYSDNCAGQNKNRYIYNLWHYLAVKHQIKVTHRFLEVGHTQAEGDSMHATIERKARNQTIYTPQEWFSLIRLAKNNKPYVVKEVSQADVFDIKKLLNDKNWLKDTDGQKIQWSNIREVQVNGNSSGILKFRYDYLSEYKTLSFYNRGRPINYAKLSLDLAYSHKLPITTAKKKGLISLCEKNLIPVQYQYVYYKLTTESEKTKAAPDSQN